MKQPINGQSKVMISTAKRFYNLNFELGFLIYLMKATRVA